MKKTFQLNLLSLDNLFEFIASFAGSNGIDEDLHFQIDLMVEELFSNMVKYGHKNGGMVEVNMEMIKNDLIIILTNFNVQPFDPRKSEPYDISQKLEDRPIGKLGLHFVNQYADQIEYQYEGNNNIITLIKHTGSLHVRN